MPLAAGGLSLDLNITVIIVIALFMLPLIFLNALVFKPFLDLFQERHRRIEGAVEDAEKTLKKAQAQAELFADRIKVATARGVEARNEIRAKAQAEMNVRLDQERAKLSEKLGDAMVELETKRAEALAKIEGQAQKLAEATASKLLGRAL